MVRKGDRETISVFKKKMIPLQDKKGCASSCKDIQLKEKKLHLSLRLNIFEEDDRPTQASLCESMHME